LLMSEIGVIGGGSWATAIVKLINDKGIPINWWIYENEIIEHLRQYGNNPSYLSSVGLNNEFLNISNDISDVVSSSKILIFGVPAVFLHQVCEKLTPNDFKDKVVVSTIKGIVPDFQCVVAEYFHNAFQVPYTSFVVVSGPSLAEEVAKERLTYLTVASPDKKHAVELAAILTGRYLKTTVNGDIIGIEYATILKNIYAIAAGISKGLGYGDNFISVLISNCHREMIHCVQSVHKAERDMSASAYLGDLIVTAYSQHSRNRTFGAMIGSGYTVKTARLEMKMIAEGYFAAKYINDITQKAGISLPICETVYRILYEGASPKKEISYLTEILK